MRKKGSVRFIVGCDLEEFRKYYRTLDGLHNYFKSLDIADVRFGELGPTEEGHISRDPSHLIVWREGETIIGHAIWHEESIDGFRTAGDKETRGALERLLGERRDFVELHEIWLDEKQRGKGYGSSFFQFFEDLMKRRGYDSIIYFTGHPAAMAICRRRGYKEVFLAGERWHIFQLILKQQ